MKKGKNETVAPLPDRDHNHASDSSAKKGKLRLSMHGREMVTGYMFILPVIIGLVFFFLPMMVRVVQYSFSDIYMAIGERYTLLPRGIFHYNHAFFVHATFVRTVTEMITDMLWNVPLIIFLACLWLCF